MPLTFRGIACGPYLYEQEHAAYIAALFRNVMRKRDWRFLNCIRVPHKTKDTQAQFLNHYYENITAADVEKMKKHGADEALSEDNCIASQIS